MASDQTTEGAGDLDDNFVNPDIPSVLSWNVECESAENFKNLFLAVYQTLRVRRRNIGAEEAEYVASKFCSLSNAVLKQKFREVHQTLGDCRATPVWAYRILRMIEVPPTMMTRSTQNAILQNLDNDSVNAALRNIYEEEEDSPDNENLPMEYVQRWISSAMNGIIYMHQKTRSGFVFYKWFENYSNGLQELSSKVDSMLLNLESRKSVNLLASMVGRDKLKMIKKYEDYIKMSDNSSIMDSYCILGPEFKEHDEINFTNFKNFIKTGVLWFHHISSSQKDIYSIREVSDAVNQLTPLVKEIRGFVPTAQDLAYEKADRLKETVTELRTKVEKFLDETETRSLVVAKSFVKHLDFCRDNCNTLRLEGVKYDENTLGASPETMEQLYQEIITYIEDAEREVKIQEHRDRLEATEVLKTAPNITLPPLHTGQDWLNFKAALDKIMNFHSSDIVKCTIVKNALRDKKDIQRCQNLNYASIIEYLEGKYQDASLLPKLIDRLLKMKSAKDIYTSYNNLNEFFATVAQLELHNGIDRIDSFVREKLVCLLLTENLQADFYKEQIFKEKEWKQESSLHNDDASTTLSCAQGKEYEEKRQTHFVDSMKIYSEIMRKIVATNQDHPRYPRRSTSGVNYVYHPHKTCPVCDSSHYGNKGNIVKSLAACPEFRAMPVHERFKLVENIGHCKVCLTPANVNHDCQRWCRYCKSTGHHDLLHFQEEESEDEVSESPDQVSEEDSDQDAHSTISEEDEEQNEAQESDYNEENDDEHSEAESAQSYYISASRNDEALAQSNHPHGQNGSRMYLPPCSNITVALPGNQLELLGLLDIGSGPSMCLKSTAVQLQLKQIDVWKGNISTIHPTKDDEYPVYKIPIKDVTGTIHNIAVIGINKIGIKTPLPNELFTRICKALGVNPKQVQNTAGPIQLILGLENIQFLTSPKHHRYGNFPGVALYESAVSPFQMIVGAVEPALTIEGQD